MLPAKERVFLTLALLSYRHLSPVETSLPHLVRALLEFVALLDRSDGTDKLRGPCIGPAKHHVHSRSLRQTNREAPERTPLEDLVPFALV